VCQVEDVCSRGCRSPATVGLDANPGPKPCGDAIAPIVSGKALFLPASSGGDSMDMNEGAPPTLDIWAT
jgi:hypothetical protein